ncbi:MAG: VWA domain-containing protein [Candidatus Sericytochromatia bacterium]|nr:VWA domain-containing protein [Candidatus Sericytochromatia bacterium]
MRLLGRILPLLSLLGLVFWLGIHLGFLRLGQPTLLSGLLVLPVLAFLAYRLQHWQKQALEKLIAPNLWQRLNLQPHKASRILPLVLQLTALFFLVIALARPQGPPILAESSDQGVDILMALDISDSSKATDLYPNRLEAAKQMIRILLSRLTSDRVGLVVFSGEAFSIVPFSHDYGAIDTLLTDIDTSMLPSRGTNIPALVELAKERFAKQSEGGHVLIVFSDGENHEGDAVAAIKKLKSARTRIFTVGVGTTAGARIPEENDDWNSLGFKQYQGQPVVSRLNESTLKSMAQAGGGTYSYVEKPLKLLRDLERVRNELPAGETTQSTLHSYEERFQWYLLWVLLLLGLEQSFGLWQNSWEKITHSVFKLGQHFNMKNRTFPKLLKFILRQALILGLASLLQSAWVWPWTPFVKQREAEQAYQAKQYPQSLEKLEQGIEAAPNEARLHYNKGNALYQSQKYSQATEAYRQALTLEGNLGEQAQTWYNLGNSYFRQGSQSTQSTQGGQQGSPEEAWKQAIDAYQKALELNPEDQQAKENKDFVQAQLKALQEQKSQNSQPEKKTNPQTTPPKKPGSNKGESPPKNQNSPPQNQAQPQQAEPQNRFSDEEIQKFLESLEESEKDNRANRYFQRNPEHKQNPSPEDLMTQPLEELEKSFNAAQSDQKDW